MAATFPGGVWIGYTVVDLVSYWNAATANPISEEIVAVETFLISTVRADGFVLAGPATGGPLAPTWRALLGSDTPIATTTTRGSIEFATNAEVQAGVDAGRCTTPAALFSDIPAVPAASRGVRLDASGDLVLPGEIKVANGESIGIDSSNERVEFYAAGLIALMGAQAAIGSQAVNTNMTVGLTIEQGAADDEAVNIRSSDVGAVLDSAVETSTYLTVTKAVASAGGATIAGYRDADSAARDALSLDGYLAEAPDTGKTVTSRAIVEISGYQTDGTDIANTAADGNVFGIQTQRGGGVRTLLLVDEDADMDLPGGRIATGYGDYWDIEDYHAGAPAADGYVQVDINGTTYQLLANIP